MLVIGLAGAEFDGVVLLGTGLTGVAKVIGMNCALNGVN